MKYQALKRLKTKTKLLKLCDTLQEAHEIIKAEGAIFDSFSYIGGFPVYAKYTTNDQRPTFYSIQGLAMPLGVVCSLPKEELSAFKF